MRTAGLIHPIILCGGSGTRLWPASVKSRPKPFLPLIGERTLFQQAVERVGDDSRFGAAVVVAGPQHVALIEQQAEQVDGFQLIIEPSAKNTAPAIALAAARLDPDAIMLVCPSDHHIADAEAFRKAALDGASLAVNGKLVSFGISPDRPETGYGYIKRGTALPGGFEIAQFVEKPDLERAQSYVASGDYSWNGGIFVFRAGTLLDELAKHRPALAEAVAQAVALGREDGGRFHPDAGSFDVIEGDSIDYAVMENTDQAAMVPVDMGWSDIGNWAALQDALQTGEGANYSSEQCDLVDCHNVMITSDGPRVSAIGLQDICIIVSGDEVLVTTRDGAQKVGKLPGAQNQ